MKTDWRDVVFTSLALFLTIGLSFEIMTLLESILADWTGRFFPIAYLLSGVLIFGILTATYLRILTLVYPIREGVYPPGHAQFTLWKHNAVLADLAGLALKPLDLALSRVLYYRLLGLRAGPDVALGKVRITDPRLTEVGDLAVVGDGSIVGAHVLVFDRILIKRVVIGRGVTIGAAAVVMPGVEIADNSVVGSLSRVEANTKIPPNEYWEGVPARKVRNLPEGRRKFAQTVE
jgi:hypothetical protein